MHKKKWNKKVFFFFFFCVSPLSLSPVHLPGKNSGKVQEPCSSQCELCPKYASNLQICAFLSQKSCPCAYWPLFLFFSPHLCKFILKSNKNFASIIVGCLMLLHIYILRDKDGRLSGIFFFPIDFFFL